MTVDRWGPRKSENSDHNKEPRGPEGKGRKQWIFKHRHRCPNYKDTLEDLGFPDNWVGKESACNAGDPGSIPGLGRHWRRDRLPIPVFLVFQCGSAGKESARNAEDLGSIPGLGRAPGEGEGYPFQYSGLENYGLYRPWGCKESHMIERLSLSRRPKSQLHLRKSYVHKIHMVMKNNRCIRYIWSWKITGIF